MKAKAEIDLRESIDKKRWRNEVLIMSEALKYYGITTDIAMDDVTVKNEKVKNYKAGIFTVRHKGKLLYRRFPMDVAGLIFRYESPIFNIISE